MPHTINKWKETALKALSGGSVNRKLDVISTIYTTCKKEWCYLGDKPGPDPTLEINQKKSSESKSLGSIKMMDSITRIF